MFCKWSFTFAKTIVLKRGLIFFILLAIVSCREIDVYETTVPFTKHSWASAEKTAFEFAISDTVPGYNVFIVLRHTDAYHYNNLWVNITTIPPGDTAQTVKANLKLGDNRQWLGNSIDDIVEHRILIYPSPLQLKN